MPNRDATRLAVGVYAQGSERKDFRIVDSTTGAQIGPVITGLDSFGWARDERYAFITPRTAESDANQEPMRCLKHRLGGDRRDDVLMLAVNDAKNYLLRLRAGRGRRHGVRDRRFLVEHDSHPSARLDRGATDDLRERQVPRRWIFKRDRMYFRTNDNAPNWKVMAASYAQPEFRDWTPLIPNRRPCFPTLTVTSTYVVATMREDVLSKLVVHDLTGKPLRELALPEFGNVSAIAYDIDADRGYATLASFTAPYKVYGFDGKSLEWKLVWQDDPPLDLSQIVATRVYVPARDGAKIPVFIVHRKDLRRDGANPTLLHVYGGFNNAVEPFYVGSYSAFINRGGVFVDAGVRGGSEYGEKWHEQAMLAQKQATFDDTIAVAEWLVSEKYTQPSKLAVEGGSNGGLTVGAVITQRPDLFRAAICQVPLLDMVRYHKFLIARYWIPEYGDPDRDGRLPLDPPLLALPERAHRREPSGNARRGRRIRLARRSAAREEVRRGSAEQPGPGCAVPAVHGFRQRARHRQVAAAARGRPRLRAAVPDERARHGRNQRTLKRCWRHAS